jgi:hypothetical protein
MRLAIIPLLAGCAFGQVYQSVNFSAGSSVGLVIPNVSQFSSPGDYRIGFRLHDWTVPTSGTHVTLFTIGYLQVVLYGPGNGSSSNFLCGVNLHDTESAYGNFDCVTVLGLNDVLVRAQKFAATYPTQLGSPGAQYFEVQDGGTGNILTYSCGGWANSGCPISTIVPTSIVGTTNMVSSAGAGFSLAWLKWWSTTVQPGTPFETETTAADIADWRFEGNSSTQWTNQATGGGSLPVLGGTSSGTIGFTGSRVEAPICIIAQQTFSTGSAGTLQNYSFPLNTGSLTYAWSQTTGTPALNFSSTTAATPAVSGGLSYFTSNGANTGSYTLQLTVTDSSSVSTSCTMKDGFVTADPSGIVQTGNAKIDSIIGPQAVLYANPWKWADDRQVAEAALQTAGLASFYNGAGGTATTPWNVAGPGTITLVNGSASVIGSSTTFLSSFCGGVAGSSSDYIVIWYPSAAILGGTGRRNMGLTCVDNTHVTLGSAWDAALTPACTGGGCSGIQYAIVPQTTYNNWNDNQDPANFYDAALSLYSLYFRSGIDSYLTTARAFADNFWQERLDSGNNFIYGESRNTFPRNMSVLGMALRAIEGRPDMWAGLEQISNFQINSVYAGSGGFGSGSTPWVQIGNAQGGDPREEGYAMMQIAAVAAFDPTVTIVSCYLGGTSTPAGCARKGLQTFMNLGWTNIGSVFSSGNWWANYNGGNGGPFQASQYTSWASQTCVQLTYNSTTVTAVNGATCSNGIGQGGWSKPVGSSVHVAPAAPTITEAAGPGGTNIPVATYTVYITYTGAFGETLPSAVATHTTTSTANVITVTGPAVSSGATGWNVYVYASTYGSPFPISLQNGVGTPIAIGTAWTELSTGLVTGPPVPVSGEFTWSDNNAATQAQPWWFFPNAGTQPSTNAGGDAAAYYPVYVDPTHVTLQDVNGNPAPYPDATCNPCYKGFEIGRTGAVGYAVQPYMLGILGTAWKYTHDALICTSPGVPANCSNSIAAQAATYVTNAANFLRQYGYNSVTGGMFYFAGSVNCAPNVSNAVAATTPGCTNSDNAGAARTLNAEGTRTVFLSLGYSGLDPTTRTFGDTLYSTMWCVPGWPCGGGMTSDGNYNGGYLSSFDGYFYGSYPGGPAQKWFGMGWGITAGAAWTGYRLGGWHVHALPAQ